MKTQFYKYQGTGNDFILIDNRQTLFNADNNLISKLCNRRFGIGADGLILLNNKPGYDFEMVYFNSDGKMSTMCGNGGRCVVAFANSLGIIINEAKFTASDGEHIAKIINSENDKRIISLQMKDVEEIKVNKDNIIMNTGSPHYIKFAKRVEQLNVVKQGSKIRNSIEYLLDGINVNFVYKEKDSLFVRTYERGVEDETLSCGTGVVASALAFAIKNKKSISSIKVRTLGGNLNVSFQKVGSKFYDIWLEGPVTLVYSGEYNI